MADIVLLDGGVAQYLGDGVFSVSQDSERGGDTVMIDVASIQRLLGAYEAAGAEA
jgi:hypothetical protein